jgi:hypothetical protein
MPHQIKLGYDTIARLNLVGGSLAGEAMPTRWIVAARSSIYYPQIR